MIVGIEMSGHHRAVSVYSLLQKAQQRHFISQSLFCITVLLLICYIHDRGMMAAAEMHRLNGHGDFAI